MTHPETTITNTYSCPDCGTDIDSELAQQANRPPCMQCGGKNIAISVACAEELNIAEGIGVGLGLGLADLTRDALERWAEIQATLREIEQQHSTGLTADNVKAARQKLSSFYVQAYHLKDVLLHDPAIGRTKQELDDAVKRTPALALLADLANLDKHYAPDKKPWSGHTPEVTSVVGVSPPDGSGGWSLRMTVTHAGNEYDGLALARSGVDAWRQQLLSWGVI